MCVQFVYVVHVRTGVKLAEIANTIFVLLSLKRSGALVPVLHNSLKILSDMLSRCRRIIRSAVIREILIIYVSMLLSILILFRMLTL